MAEHIAALERDRERMDAIVRLDIEIWQNSAGWTASPGVGEETYTRDELRDAIDAAMEAEEG